MVVVWNQILSERTKRHEFSVSKKVKNPKLKKAKGGRGYFFGLFFLCIFFIPKNWMDPIKKSIFINTRICHHRPLGWSSSEESPFPL